MESTKWRGIGPVVPLVAFLASSKPYHRSPDPTMNGIHLKLSTFVMLRLCPRVIFAHRGIPKASVAFLRYSFSYGVSALLDFWTVLEEVQDQEQLTDFSPCAGRWRRFCGGSGDSISFASHCALVLDGFGAFAGKSSAL